MQGTGSAERVRTRINLMNRYLILAAAVLLVATPLGTVQAAGSGDGGSDSLPSVDDTYRQAVQAVDAKKYRKAISLLNDVIDQQPRHPDALNYLGYSHRKSGDYARAVTYYQKAISLDADHRGANEYLGQAYVELGNIPAAEKQLAALKRICGADCDEYLSLKQSLDAVVAKRAKQG